MEDLKDKVDRFLSVCSGDGSGYGYGDGSGSGDGSGYGYGDGSGSGDGYGSGSGSGYGSGYGDGSGDGSGYGSGYGYGYGDGSGSGDGYGIKNFCGSTVYIVDNITTIIDRVHSNIAHGSILNSGLTLTPCWIVKNGNMFAHGKTLQAAQDALTEKMFAGMDEEERISAFLDAIDSETVYPVMTFFDWHHKLTGSCEMGRKSFARDHEIDLEHDSMTRDEFLELVKDSYGGNIIHKVIEICAENGGKDENK